MKKKYIIINVLLSLTILFSILFQALHSYEHHSELVERHCNHHYSKDKTEVSHSHSISEKCMVCDFNFSSFTTANFYVISFHKNSLILNTPLFYFQKHSSFFKGCLFSLRAPPLF
ncbi:hypothetical protein D0809_17205 [Flavobacterium circumlabens]|uniref:DUF2946 domain-containing protein n=1 Tax=Flavobacterium circumlabens TaxID=2133765 RepID=A0A4Y7U9Q3_9FLAO|nr:hypothetical protein D0809_17205 [Flavobacterium circumlabens]